MAHSLPTISIGRHLECAIHTELVVELEIVLIERKHLVDFNAILSYTQMFSEVGNVPRSKVLPS